MCWSYVLLRHVECCCLTGCCRDATCVGHNLLMSCGIPAYMHGSHRLMAWYCHINCCCLHMSALCCRCHQNWSHDLQAASNPVWQKLKAAQAGYEHAVADLKQHDAPSMLILTRVSSVLRHVAEVCSDAEARPSLLNEAQCQCVECSQDSYCLNACD